MKVNQAASIGAQGVSTIAHPQEGRPPRPTASRQALSRRSPKSNYNNGCSGCFGTEKQHLISWDQQRWRVSEFG